MTTMATVRPLTGTEEEGFAIFHGVALVEIGEEGAREWEQRLAPTARRAAVNDHPNAASILADARRRARR